MHDQLWQKTPVEETKEIKMSKRKLIVWEQPARLSAERWLDSLTISRQSAKMIEVIRTTHSCPQKWACGAAGSALPWHGRGRRFDPDQVHQIPQQVRQDERLVGGRLCHGLCHNPPFWCSGVNPQGETVLNDTRAFELKFSALG